jgi:hypothetical protein
MDHSGIHSKSLTSGWQGIASGIAFEVRLDAQNGKFHSVYFIYKPQGAIGSGVVSVQFNTK